MHAIKHKRQENKHVDQINNINKQTGNTITGLNIVLHYVQFLESRYNYIGLECEHCDMNSVHE